MADSVDKKPEGGDEKEYSTSDNAPGSVTVTPAEPAVEKVQEKGEADADASKTETTPAAPRKRFFRGPLLPVALLVLLYYFAWSPLGWELEKLNMESTLDFLGSTCCVGYNIYHRIVYGVDSDVPPLSYDGMCPVPPGNHTVYDPFAFVDTKTKTSGGGGWCSREARVLIPDFHMIAYLVSQILLTMFTDIGRLLRGVVYFVGSLLTNSIYLALVGSLSVVFLILFLCCLTRLSVKRMLGAAKLSRDSSSANANGLASPASSKKTDTTAAKDGKTTDATKPKPDEPVDEHTRRVSFLMKAFGINLVDFDLDDIIGQGQNKVLKQGTGANSITLQDYKGASEAKKELELVVDFLKDPTKYHDLGARFPRGVLLYGPPGTGKTLFARALAGEAKVAFIHKCASEFRSKFVGSGARNIRSLFATARQHAPCILFIDEIDSISKRTSSELHPYANQAINQILHEMDGFIQNETAVIVIGATNRIDNLDEALLRPGRFDQIVHVDLPDFNSRKEIIEHYIARLKKVGDLNVAAIASKTDEYSGAELEQLVNQAALIAVRGGADKVEQKHLDMAVEKRGNAQDKMKEYDPNNYKPSSRKAIEHMYN